MLKSMLEVTTEGTEGTFLLMLGLSLSLPEQVWGWPCCEPSVCVLHLPGGD